MTVAGHEGWAPDELRGERGRRRRGRACLIGEDTARPVVGRVPGRGLRDRGVRGSLEDPRVPQDPALGGAFRRDRLRASGRAHLERCSEGMRAHPRAGRRGDRHRKQRPGRSRSLQSSRCQGGSRQSRRRRSGIRGPRTSRSCSQMCSTRQSRARSSRSSTSPTVPTCSCSARLTPSHRSPPSKPVAAQIGHAACVPYGKFLSWRNMVEVEPPNRPTPNRVVVVGCSPLDGLEVRFRGLP